MSVLAIYDLDGCLSDDEWRRDHAAAHDWAAYHGALHADKPMNLHHISAAFPFAISTARPEEFREDTIEWIEINLGWEPGTYMLAMRRDSDMRPSPAVKAEHIAEWCAAGFTIGMICDDRVDVLEQHERDGHDPHKLYLLTKYSFMRLDVLRATFPGREAPGTVPGILKTAARTFAERNAMYGDTYIHCGAAMAAAFPNGLTARTPEEFARLGCLVQCWGKLLRYSAMWNEGGHQDSAHDLSVYAAMLESLT